MLYFDRIASKGGLIFYLWYEIYFLLFEV